MVFSLNIDLIKSYDRVDLSYLKLILLQIGLSLDMVEWIMSAITIARFVLLINSVPTEFFKGSRGIQQGCPLSSYLFILEVEVLSILIQHKKKQSHFQCLMTARGLSFSHLLFVDDVIIIGEGSIEEWKYMKYVVKMFCKAFDLEVGNNKSLLLHSCKE